MCSSSILKLYIDLSINSTLKINNVSIKIVSTSQNLSRTRWYVHSKKIINPFIFIKFTKVIFKIISYIERLDWRTITSYIPYIDSWIISTENIIITLKWIMYTSNSPYKLIKILSFLFIWLTKSNGWFFWLWRNS